MFTATKGKALLTTTTGALPRPSWYTANLRGLPLSHGFAQTEYREQHFDCLACNVAAQHRAGIDIFVDGDARLDNDVAGRSWVSYATERIEGIGAPRVEVQPASFMADKGPGDIMWEVIETRMTPPVTGQIGKTTLQLDRAYKAIAGMTDRPVKIGSISAQILALMLTDEFYNDRLKLLFDLSTALNREYHALADAGAPIVQVEEPAIHQIIHDPRAPIKPQQWVEAFNVEVKGLRAKCEVWCHTCWGSPAAQRVASRDQSYRNALPYFDQLDVDVITFEGAYNRGLDFEAIGKTISKDKKIAVGVISHRTLQVERAEEVAELIRAALKYIEPERLILSSDCGFGRQSMSRMHAFYKMVALVRGANIVRKELGLPEAYIPAADPRLSMVPLMPA
ncbi:MAG TPA: cobalamin-independent methionine synthase II family protein [Xanthobacteraceae bacterium]|nr:cobalamin-independent methionine synthase II family protein [Xanthobacteraceae bacterium]